MTKEIQLSGLCINCLNARECSYRVNHMRPIIFCEEFLCANPSESKYTITGSVSKVENPINSPAKGICSNCENIETCSLQKTDNTVIYCEEYR